MAKIKRRFIKSIQACLYLLLLGVGFLIGIVEKLINKDYRDVWLISERGVDARDNAYVFFKYLCEKHPEINSYYIIDKKSADYHKVKDIGKLVTYKSLKHYIMLTVSKYNISTHLMGFTPNMVIFVWLDHLHIIKGKKIFLQHGIIKDNMKFCHYPNIRVDIFNTSALPEYEYVNREYGHANGVVQMLGMCRYDNLIKVDDIVKRQILIMPTWRNDIILTCRSNEEFIKTNYYKAYQSLLNNKKLIELLDKESMDLVFYPHLEMQKYLNTFHTKCERVKIASFEDYDVQQLLVESMVLITDYSSIYFDFAYMNKPLIYYQFDEEEYRKLHYQEGYFIYRRDGFGPVVTTEKDIIEYLYELNNNDWVLQDMFRTRIDNFFSFRDNNNCERTYNAICNL